MHFNWILFKSRSINPTSPIYPTTRSELSPLSLILDLKAYSSNPTESPSIPTFSHSSIRHSHAHSHTITTPSPPSTTPAAPRSAHLASISSTIIPLPPLFHRQYDLLINWIQLLLWSPEQLPEPKPTDIHVLRLKGIVWAAAGDEEVLAQSESPSKRKGWVIQGVRGVYEVEDVTDEDEREHGQGSGNTSQTQGKVVVIGKGGQGLAAGLKTFLGLDPVSPAERGGSSSRR